MDSHRPRRRFGQNFLADEGAAARIVARLAPRPGEAVLEIGPGRGAITRRLIDSGARVAAIEIDRDLVGQLRTTFAAALHVVEGDVLDQSFAAIAGALGVAGSAGLAVVGNLPYYVSKPIALKLVAERAVVSRAVLMFQREVAARLTARPGSKDYSPLTVLCGLAFHIERAFDVPPGAFRPAPKVVSTVTSWTRKPDAELSEAWEPALRACLTAAFAQRRKTLLANVRAALQGDEPAAIARLAAAGLDPSARAETIPPEGFVRLARAWRP